VGDVLELVHAVTGALFQSDAVVENKLSGMHASAMHLQSCTLIVCDVNAAVCDYMALA
jgi:hypothetical protein